MKAVEGHLADIGQNTADKSAELEVLTNIIKTDELSLPEFIGIAGAGNSALSLRRAFNISPKGVSELPDQITSQIEERILSLETSGVHPSSNLEITPQTMASFMGNVSNYLFECSVSAVDALSSTAKKVMESRVDPKKATLFEAFLNTAIDQTFKGIIGGEDLAPIAQRIGYGAAGVYGGAGLNITTGSKPKSTALPVKMAIKTVAKSRSGPGEAIVKAGVVAVGSVVVGQALNLKNDMPDIIGHGIIGALESQSATGALYAAAKRAMFKNLWKVSGGKAELQALNFMESANYYLLSKKTTDLVLQSVCQLGEEAIVTLADHVGIGGQAAKVAAGIAGVAILMAVNNYLSQDKVKAHNPELITSIKEDLSSNIQDIREVQRQEELEMRSVVARSSREDQITISTGGGDKEFAPKEAVPMLDEKEKSWGVAAWEAKQAVKDVMIVPIGSKKPQQAIDATPKKYRRSL